MAQLKNHEADRFIDALEGVSDPEVKRKTIGRLFIEVFEARAAEVGDAKFLAQGTLYPDVIESVSFTGGPSVTIKSHHNVGGLPERMNMKLVEPLRELFKDEVRVLGRELGLPDAFVGRHPFPGPGLAIRIIGAVTKDRLCGADARFRHPAGTPACTACSIARRSSLRAESCAAIAAASPASSVVSSRTPRPREMTCSCPRTSP